MRTIFTLARGALFAACATALTACGTIGRRDLVILSPDIGAIPGIEPAAQIVYPTANIVNSGIRDEVDLVAKVVRNAATNGTASWVQFGGHGTPETVIMGADPSAVIKTVRTYDRVMDRRESLDAREDHLASIDHNLGAMIQHRHGYDRSLPLSPGEKKTEASAFGMVSMIHLLESLATAQKSLGTTLSNEYVFAACVDMDNLSSGDVGALRKLAQKLDAKITGSTGLYALGVATMVTFMPNGDVVRTPGLAYNNPIAWTLKMQAEAMGYNDAWADCHVGHTQEEGATCQRMIVLRRFTPGYDAKP